MSAVTLLSRLEGAAGERDRMKFRLYYEGELRPSGRDPVGAQSDQLAEHKHKIRKQFHPQMKELWRTNKFLSTHTVDGAYWGMPGKRPNLRDALAAQYNEYGYRFVPLVCERFDLLCSLSVLFLRRDTPGSIIYGGDIDNRLKTIIDALRRPRNALELRGNEAPAADEDPFFCLLDDDKQVTHFEVETDTLLTPPLLDNNADARLARLVVTVELKPYNVDMFNLSFS